LLGRIREPVWSVEKKNSHGFLYKIADSCTGRLSASSPQFEVLRTVVIPLAVPMMHLFFVKRGTFKHRSHDLCMLCDVPSLVGIGMLRFPDVNIAVASLVPALA
jgi:hypothetical protein